MQFSEYKFVFFSVAWITPMQFSLKIWIKVICNLFFFCNKIWKNMSYIFTRLNSFQALPTFLVVTPSLLLCLLKVLPRKPACLHPMLLTPNRLVPRILISYSSPWRWLQYLLRKLAGLHLILVTPKLVPGVLISCSSPWRLLRSLFRKLTLLHLIIKFPRLNLS